MGGVKQVKQATCKDVVLLSLMCGLSEAEVKGQANGLTKLETLRMKSKNGHLHT